MKISLIIAVYKDVESLELIIESLRNQTYKNFEVIIAEDGN
ncbi:glycosyltransferase, partial [Aliarcobacter butzleri]